MFHFPASTPTQTMNHLRVTPHNRCWVSPFGPPRLNALLATPRGITQPHTSFIGPACQGIHRAPLDKHESNNQKGKNSNNNKKNKMLASTLQFSHTTHNDQPNPETLRFPAGVTVPHTNHQHQSKNPGVCGAVPDTRQRADDLHPTPYRTRRALWWPPCL